MGLYFPDMGAEGWYLNSPPSVVSWSDRLDISLTGADDSLFVMTWTSLGGWYEWAKMGGNWATYTPTQVSWGKGRIDVFVVGSTDGKMYHYVA